MLDKVELRIWATNKLIVIFIVTCVYIWLNIVNITNYIWRSSCLKSFVKIEECRRNICLLFLALITIFCYNFCNNVIVEDLDSIYLANGFLFNSFIIFMHIQYNRKCFTFISKLVVESAFKYLFFLHLNIHISMFWLRKSVKVSEIVNQILKEIIILVYQ